MPGRVSPRKPQYICRKNDGPDLQQNLKITDRSGPELRKVWRSGSPRLGPNRTRTNMILKVCDRTRKIWNSRTKSDPSVSGPGSPWIPGYELCEKKLCNFPSNEHLSFSPSSPVFLWSERMPGRVSHSLWLTQKLWYFRGISILKKIILIISMLEIVPEVMRMTHHLSLGMTHLTIIFPHLIINMNHNA